MDVGTGVEDLPWNNLNHTRIGMTQATQKSAARPNRELRD